MKIQEHYTTTAVLVQIFRFDPNIYRSVSGTYEKDKKHHEIVKLINKNYINVVEFEKMDHIITRFSL